MNLAIALQMLLRLIPSGLLFLCTVYSVKDPSLRKKWAEFLFRTGNIPASKREDISIQESVRIPFLVGAVLFLFWPVIYYFRDSYTEIPIIPITVPTAKPTPTKTPRGAGAPTPTPAPVLHMVAPIPQDIPGQSSHSESVFFPTPTPQPGAPDTSSGTVVLPSGNSGGGGGPAPAHVN